MSAQRLGDKAIRRLSRNTGLDVVRGWAHGGYTFDFVVAADEVPERHLHGWYDKKTGDWELEEPGQRDIHYNTCFTELFPEGQGR